MVRFGSVRARAAMTTTTTTTARVHGTTGIVPTGSAAGSGAVPFPSTFFSWVRSGQSPPRLIKSCTRSRRHPNATAIGFPTATGSIDIRFWPFCCMLLCDALAGGLAGRQVLVVVEVDRDGCGTYVRTYVPCRETTWGRHADDDDVVAAVAAAAAALLQLR